MGSFGGQVLTLLAVIVLYNEKERRKAEECVHRMVKKAVEMEGTVTVSLKDSISLEFGETDGM